MLAKDLYDNVVVSFANSANLTDNTGTINPTTTTNFNSGSWTGNVTIVEARNDVEISALQGSSSGTSNKFNVQPTGLHHFEIKNITVEGEMMKASIANHFISAVMS